MSIGKKVPKQDTMEHGGSLGQSPTNSTRERATTRRPHPHLPPAHIGCVRVSPAGALTGIPKTPASPAVDLNGLVIAATARFDG